MARQSVFSRRELDTYPHGWRRVGLILVVVTTTTVTFYQIYVQGAVSPYIIADFSVPLWTYVMVSIVGNAVGAVAAWATGVADRWGRVNLILAGSAIAAVVAGLVLPNTESIGTYTASYGALSLVGGVVLVASSALVRDLSPQMGRGLAMGLWTLGPSLGSLLISAITLVMLPAHPEWQYHIRFAGLLGAVSFLVAVVVLRDLSPTLRAQVLVNMKERAVAEARARSVDMNAGGRRSIWRPAVVFPAVGIGLFLMFYVTRVGFLVLYFVSNFALTPSSANGLASWYWSASAISLVATGLLSDRLGVRKPILVAAGAISIVALALFAQMAKRPETTYTEFVVILVVLAASGSAVSCMWLTMFSETLERIDPSSIARGMAVYGATLRTLVVATLVGFMVSVSAPAVLVDQGQRVASINTAYAVELQTIGADGFAAVGEVPVDVMADLREDPSNRRVRTTAEVAMASVADPAGVLDAVLAIPAQDLAYLAEHGPDVQKAVERGPGEWQRWWWVCVIGQVLVFPLSLRMNGRWSVRGAAQDARNNEARIAEELQRLPSNQ